MKRSFFALLGLLLTAVGSTGYAVHYMPHRLADCAAAASFASAHPDVGLYEYRISGRFVHATVTHVPTLGYRGDGQIRYSFLAGSTIVKLPQWSWPNMTASERRGLADFIEALRNHEEGHAQIAQRGIAGRQSTIVVFANSQAAAKSQMAAALSNQLRALYDEILQTEKTYDRVTSHGMQQSDGPMYGFRGGDDVVFTCH